MSDFQKKMGGVIAEAIAPALIMILIGSLVFFLAEVFYHGQYLGRMRLILAWWVFGSVLVCRIAITEGRERSIAFGLALAFVVWIALNRFVEIQGALAPFKIFINAGFICLSWWCASKLVWDCTLLDGSRDTSNKGLMQRIGLNRLVAKLSGQTAADDMDEDAEEEQEEVYGATSETSPRQMNWLQKIVRLGKGKNTPGLTVVYFSIAAVPIFGLGQGFIPVEDEFSRQFSFKMFVCYMLAGLGLLLTTSLFALQHYLLKRDVALPNPIAISWIVTGLLMTVAILAAAWILPRPYPEYSFGEAPIRFESPTDLQSSEYAMFGDDGPDDQPSNRVNNERDQTGENTSDQGKEKSSQSSDNSQSKQETSGGKSESKSENKSDSKSQPQQSDSSDSSKSKSDSSNEGKSSSPDKQSSDSKSGKGKQDQNQQGDSDKSDSKGDQSSKSDDAKQSDASEQNENKNDSKTDGDSKDDQQDKNQSEPDKRSNDSQSAQNQSSDSKSGRNKSEKAQQKNSSNRKSRTPAKQPSRVPQVKINPSLGAFATVLKWLFYALVAIVGIFLAWKYRRQIMESWRSFLRELRELLDRLFGRRQAVPDAAELTSDEMSASARGFHDFVDPFASGQSQQMPVEELVAYCFAAFEAWGRDNQLPREADQTPHEYAEQVGVRQKHIAAGAKAMADLYCQAAYSKAELPTGTRRHLARFWKMLQQHRVEPLSAEFDPLTGAAVT